MQKLFLALLFLPTLLFGASIPFSGLQPDQFGSNVSSGKMWVKTGFVTTNGVSTGSTNYGDTARTNWTWMDASGWHTTNTSGASKGMDFINGDVGIGAINTGRKFTVSTAVNSTVSTFVLQNIVTNVGSGTGMLFAGLDSASNLTFYSAFLSTIADNTDGSEDGSLAIRNLINGSLTTIIQLVGGNVGINTTTPQERLDVQGSATIRTNGHFGGVMTATNGVGSLAVDATVNIGATGWTNTFGKNAVVYLDGTAVTFSIKNSAGTSIYTNAVSLTGEATVILQPGGAVITSGTGVAGRATPF